MIFDISEVGSCHGADVDVRMRGTTGCLASIRAMEYSLVVSESVDEIHDWTDEASHLRNLAGHNIETAGMLDIGLSQYIELQVADNILISLCDRDCKVNDGIYECLNEHRGIT